MAINSNQKGKRFERLLAAKLREYGYNARRSVQYCGKSGEAADIVNLPYIHVEAKHVKRLNIYEAMEQAKRDAKAGGKGDIPAVFHKKNNKNILVTVEFEDFMQLYKAFENSYGKV